MYFAKVLNEDKCGKLYVNRRQSLQTTQNTEQSKMYGQVEQQDLKRAKRQIFRRKSYADCGKGLYKSSYVQKVDALCPISTISQHVKIEQQLKEEMNFSSQCQKQTMSTGTFLKSVRFTAKMKRTRILNKHRGSQFNINVNLNELNIEKSPSQRGQSHGLDTPRRRDDSRQNSIVNTPSWKTVNGIQSPLEDKKNGKKNLKSMMLISDGSKPLSQFQRSQSKTVAKKEGEQTPIDQQINSSNQIKDNLKPQEKEDQSNSSFSNSQMSNKQQTEVCIPTLSNINSQFNVNFNGLRHQNSIQLNKEDADPKSSSISQFQDEVIETSLTKINKKYSDDQTPEKQFDKLETLKEEHALEALAHQQSIRERKRSISADSGREKKIGNSQFSKFANEENKGDSSQQFNQISLKIPLIQKIELDKSNKFTLKRQLSNRETPSSSLYSQSNFDGSKQSQQKFMYVTNYWRFVEKVHSNSNQILQNIQNQRREQAQLLNQQQITIPFVPIKKFHKKIKIDFENQEYFKTTLTSRFSQAESQEINKGYLSSRLSSPLKSNRKQNSKLSLKGAKTFQKPQTSEQELIQQKSGQSLLKNKQYKQKIPSGVLFQDDNSQQNLKLLYSPRQNHYRSASHDASIQDHQKKQWLAPLSQHNIGEQIKKHESQYQQTNIKKSRQSSPLSGKKNSFSRTQMYFDNYQVQKVNQKQLVNSSKKL
ncbi:hypothetical protein TTHERM_00898190 (macronuclear) [Tetrahymena thermophila SB210]|uniref:Uncharacterized protein n=1 Tax=Tetrahymena thermophila (strain SB210) TaxID=312017 RepID=Q23YE5_TETTS|nr:hypothetical protein TTHERM_00898190 [Tetrahymena thermophila SB210]EAS01519.2 hypothetical protein TTHERM_00898190 [Tetrahymena thermophila SB210]|eukprot:XP_001021764.2 hypothetical protein TTHERM_00898190 [Tetrahymena thermophila SB210]